MTAEEDVEAEVVRVVEGVDVLADVVVVSAPQDEPLVTENWVESGVVLVTRVKEGGEARGGRGRSAHSTRV